MKAPIRYISLFFFMAVIQNLSAQEEHRPIDPERLEKIRRDADYRYEERITFKLWEWLGKIGEYIRRALSRVFDSDIALPQSGVSRIVLWVLAILAALAVVYIIFRGNWIRIFSRKRFSANRPDYSVYEENIHEMNFADEIEAAIRSGNLRKATRLFYLRALKELSDAGRLEWQINKTNSDYLQEIKDPVLRRDFAFLCTAFEYIWYGEFQPSDALYEETFSRFREFSAKLKEKSAVS
jgi:hypothetical protein